MKRKKNKLRIIIQIVFFAVIALFAINHTLTEAGYGFLPSVSLHAICPFGGVETFLSLVTAGVLVKKVRLASVVLMVIVMALAVLLGPVFCGWVCPLGSFSEWIGKIGKKIFKEKYNNFVPRKADKLFRYLRYIVLLLVTYTTFTSLTLTFVAYDPYYALFNFWSGEVAISALIVLMVTIIASLFVERPWCKYLCPYGALLGITNLFSIFKLKRNSSTCINCSKCSNVCPMNIEVHKKETVLDHQCIKCLECTSEFECPVEDTLDFRVGKGGLQK